MKTPVFGIISPHPPIFVERVGGSRSHVTQDSLDALSRAAAALARYEPHTVVLMSPHAPALSDAFLVDDSVSLSGSLAQFGDPVVRTWKGDPDLAYAIAREIASSGRPVVLRTEDKRLDPGHLDHASLVPLEFLDPGRAYHLVVLSLSNLGYAAHRDVGAAVALAAEKLDRKVAFVASGDLSHRLTPDAPAGYSPRAAELDEEIVSCVEQGHLSDLAHIDPSLIEAGGECGLRSFIALGGFANSDPVPTRVLSYEGPWGVGYLTALVGSEALRSDDVQAPARTPDRGSKGGAPGDYESEIVRLARVAISAHLGDTRHAPDTHLVDPRLPARAGVFVSLHRGGELRGCIGTISPTRERLGEEVVANAVEAAVHDPRFPPLTREELHDLDIKVDVLHPAEPATADDLDPKRYGVIVTSGWRRGLLLPDLEGVEDVQTQLAIALRKAGISPDEPYTIERFRVDRYT